MFLSTRNYDYLYKFIVGASKLSCEKLVKKKLKLEIFELKKIPNLNYFLFLIFILLSGKIFKKNRARLKYKNIEIGRFVLAQTYFSFDTYLNKFIFYKMFLKNLFRAGKIIRSCEYYNNNFNVKGAYADHCGYLNGIIYSYFAQKKIPVYTNNYPHGIFYVNNKINKKKYLEKYEGAIKINLKRNISQNQKKQSEKKISELTKKKNFIPWLTDLKFKKISNLNYKKFDYVIYAHSFTDGQMWYGYDGFENTLDWLKFTLNFFKNKKKNILVKPHPNFYNSSLAIYAEWDKKIYSQLKNEYKNYKNMYFLNSPIQNYELQRKLDPSKCIAVTKYGSVILESSFMKFKSICSEANFFNSNFKISNRWSNPEEYEKLLNSEFKKLKEPNKLDLLKLSNSLFFVYNSVYNDNSYFEKIISKSLNLSGEKFKKMFITTARTTIPSAKIKKLDKIVKNNLKKINLRVEKSIWNVTK